MRRLIAAAAVILVVGTVMALADNSAADKPEAPKPDAPKAEAAQPATMNFHSYGGTAREAVEGYSEMLGYKLKLDNSFDTEDTCWIHMVAASPENVRCALEHSLASAIVVNDKKKTITCYGIAASASHGSARIYDVSAHCGRYVDYVNKYGKAKLPAAPRAGEPPLIPVIPVCAAEHLRDVMADVLWAGAAGTATAIGDRLLVRAGDATDGRIREFLYQLVADAPGVPASVAAAIEAQGKLDKAVEVKVEETPAASVLMEIARKCEQSVYLTPFAKSVCGSLHVTVTSETNESGRHLVDRLSPDVPLQVRYRNGSIVIDDANDKSAPHDCYFVFELAGLLERLAKAYERQRTASGREGGYDGSLRDEGGMGVVSGALNSYFGDDAQRMKAGYFGSRLIVQGGPEIREEVVEILKGLGWEDPAASPDEPHGR
ncbi:MAG: hypothetical protein IT462_12275 [Planctomycetes bacterium]|nr:hypothetical protein [Planctomycetota bacterium]